MAQKFNEHADPLEITYYNHLQEGDVLINKRVVTCFKGQSLRTVDEGRKWVVSQKILQLSNHINTYQLELQSDKTIGGTFKVKKEIFQIL